MECAASSKAPGQRTEQGHTGLQEGQGLGLLVGGAARWRAAAPSTHSPRQSWRTSSVQPDSSRRCRASCFSSSRAPLFTSCRESMAANMPQELGSLAAGSWAAGAGGASGQQLPQTPDRAERLSFECIGPLKTCLSPRKWQNVPGGGQARSTEPSAALCRALGCPRCYEALGSTAQCNPRRSP